MPRKTKDQTEKEELKEKKSTAKKTTATAKKATAKKTTATKKTATVKKSTTTKKATTKTPVEKSATKKAETSKDTTSKKASAVKEAKASVTKKSTVAKKSTTTKKAPTKATTTKKASSNEKAPTKKAATKSSATTKKSSSTKTTKKTSVVKESKASASKKATTKKATTKKASAATKKATATKKTTAKKTTTRKTTKKAIAKVEALPLVEYYDLPYRYNQTIVKLLAQTPTTLFVYWDISDEDRENYKKTFGEYFFEETKPVLIVKNNTMNYSFEVEINDFANSWYLHVNDSKCDYSIELGRRPISAEAYNKMSTDYIYVTTSNDIESPNDRILFNIDEQRVYYRNVKNNVTTTRQISFINSMGRIYNIYDLYNALYESEKEDEGFADIIKGMPSSSGLSSSTSSWFK